MKLNLKTFVSASLVAGAFVLFSVTATAGPCPALGNIGPGCNETIGGFNVSLTNSSITNSLNDSGNTYISRSTIIFDDDDGWASGGGCGPGCNETIGGFNVSLTNSSIANSLNDSGNTYISGSIIIFGDDDGDTFATPLANGASTFFTLEAPPTGGISVVVRPSVPEPASLAILGAALAGFGLLRRRKT